MVTVQPVQITINLSCNYSSVVLLHNLATIFRILVLQTGKKVMYIFKTSQKVVPLQLTSKITEEHSQASKCG